MMTSLTGREYVQQILAELDGRPFPLSGQWELTCRCNLKCVMCYTDPFNTPERIKQELTFEEIIRILHELQEAGCLYLCFTGGEPLARRDFLEIYTYAKMQGFLLSIFTNGTLITERVADHLVAYPPRMIEISFHGLTQATFENITQGKGSYARVLKAIRLLLERKLPLTLKTTGMTVNREEILLIKRFVARLGSVQYQFGPDMRSRLDGSEDPYRYQLSDEVIWEIEQADPALREERERQDRCRAECQRQGKMLCGGGRYRFHIDAYGQLQLCSNNRRRSYDLRHGTFKEGFYQYLPHCPCPNRVSGSLLKTA